MVVFDETGAGWRVGERIAVGGEGGVFRLADRPEWCVKIYHKRPLAPARRAKLEALRALSFAARSVTALPLSLVSGGARSSEWIGVLLPFVEGHDIYELYNPQGRRAHFRNATFEFLVAAALNLARAFEVVHAHGLIVGDINEQNIRVRSDATLTLIDCDGFQIQDGSRAFASNIGTPIWTPPELQGQSLEGVLRTRNHDGFGLAQLIFLLLFGGRYPFAGRPLSQEALSPEEAIARCAFAFDPDPVRPLLEPPPGAPRLEMLPTSFTRLFLRAFREESKVPDARPTPKEWAEALGELRGNLVRCESWQAHIHWVGASGCPWCGVLEGAGADLFPGPPVVRHQGVAATQGEASPENLARQLLLLQFEPFALVPPSKRALQEAFRQAGVSEPAWWQPLSQGLGPVSGWLFNSRRRSLLAEWKAAQVELAAFPQKAANLYLRYASGLLELQQRVRQLGRELQATVSRAERAVDRYLSRHRNAELTRFLETFLVRRYELQGISAGRKAALLSHNIITAADVTADAVRAVPGFPESLVERMLRWRRDCERGFRYTEPAWVPESVQASAKEETQRGAAKLMQQGSACLARWNRTCLEYGREHESLQAVYHAVYAQCAILEQRLRLLS